ncbi:MAG: hypothetical protein FWH27_16230 [Planctomycetaceae bacterium]|nr:hypothetical protein [Planctomycetaceae bacterium]
MSDGWGRDECETVNLGNKRLNDRFGSILACTRDTTELDFTRPEQQVQDAGPLGASSRHAAFLHLSEAFSENRIGELVIVHGKCFLSRGTTEMQNAECKIFFHING